MYSAGNRFPSIIAVLLKNMFVSWKWQFNKTLSNAIVLRYYFIHIRYFLTLSRNHFHRILLFFKNLDWQPKIIPVLSHKLFTTLWTLHTIIVQYKNIWKLKKMSRCYYVNYVIYVNFRPCVGRSSFIFSQIICIKFLSLNL